MTDRVWRDRDYRINVADIENDEYRNGIIPNHCVLIFRTGWSRYWFSRQLYFGTNLNDVRDLHFPGLDPQAAMWLVEKRSGVVGVGIEGPSMDHGQYLASGLRAHDTLMAKNIYVIENINHNVAKVPSRGATVSVAPINLDQAGGAPARVWVRLPSYRRK